MKHADVVKFEKAISDTALECGDEVEVSILEVPSILLDAKYDEMKKGSSKEYVLGFDSTRGLRINNSEFGFVLATFDECTRFFSQQDAKDFIQKWRDAAFLPVPEGFSLPPNRKQLKYKDKP